MGKWITKLLCVMIIMVSGPVLIQESDATIEDYSKYAVKTFARPLQPGTRDISCLAKAIYYEAANQSELGKEAIALVIVNRVHNKRYPKTICAVVRQAHIVKEKKVCQFSFWCNEELEKPTFRAWKESVGVAQRVMTNYWQRELIDTPLSKAIYYHADYVKPQWRTQKVFVGKIGNHLFYADQQLTLT